MKLTVFTWLLSAEILVDRFDELVRRPCAGVAAVPAAESLDRIGLADLIERHPLADPGANPIANDRHHVAIVDDVGFVADEAVPRYDHGATFLPDEGNRRGGDTGGAGENVR